MVTKPCWRAWLVLCILTLMCSRWEGALLLLGAHCLPQRQAQPEVSTVDMQIYLPTEAGDIRKWGGQIGA